MHAYKISGFGPDRDNSHKIASDLVENFQAKYPPTGMFFEGVKLEPRDSQASLYTFKSLMGHRWMDWYDSFSGWILVSKRFREFLTACAGPNPCHYQFLDIHLSPSSEPMPSADYKLINFLSHYDAVDWKKSRYERHDNGDVRSIWDCYFRKEIVDNCRHLFRLKGYEVASGVSAQLAGEIEKGRFTGCSVIEIPFAT